MSGNINVGNYESGGRTRVNQQPGGNSTLQLGWGVNEPSVVNRNPYRQQNKQRDSSQGHMQSYGRDPIYDQPKRMQQPINIQNQNYPQYGNFEVGDSIDSMVNLMNHQKLQTPNQQPSYNLQNQMNYNQQYPSSNQQSSQQYNGFDQNRFGFQKPPKPSQQGGQGQFQEKTFQPQQNQFSMNQYSPQYQQQQQQQQPFSNNQGINHPQPGFSNGYKVAQPPGGKSNFTFG